LAVVLALTAVMVRLSWDDPRKLHRQGLELFHEGRYEDAEPLLLRSIAAAPSSPAAYYSDYYHSLSAFRMRRWPETRARFADFLRDYPDGELAGEAHFRVAEALQNIGRSGDAAARFLHIIDEFPTSQWAGYSVERLEALMAERAGAATGAGTTAF
jgi:tetratricopeptide (TPR) repeat protein